MFGAIEAGGTKFLVAAGDPSHFTQIEIPTTTPEVTLRQTIEFLKPFAVATVGLACFGPIQLNPKSSLYGEILRTPKLGWRNYNIVRFLENALGVPVAVDTDVNAAALAERVHIHSLVYFTIGTGIGAGAIVQGRPIHGVVHPELGHIPIRRHPQDSFAGICPSHGDCLEGLASGPAIAARWGGPAEALPADHPAWDIEAYYLGAAALTAALAYSPGVIIFGGGVMRRTGLMDKVKAEFEQLAAGYLPNPTNIVVRPARLENPGLLGAFLLAQQISGTTESHEA